MLEIERVERAAPVLDMLTEGWALRQEAQQLMHRTNRKKNWAKSEYGRMTYAWEAQGYGDVGYAVDEAMTQWVQWLLSHKLTNQAEIYRVMGAPTGAHRTGPRGRIVSAGRDLAKDRRPQNPVEFPTIPDDLKNPLQRTWVSYETENATLLREMYTARERMRIVNRAQEPETYAALTIEFEAALTEVWDLYPGSVLMRVCKTTANSWLEQHYKAGIDRKEW